MKTSFHLWKVIAVGTLVFGLGACNWVSEDNALDPDYFSRQQNPYEYLGLQHNAIVGKLLASEGLEAQDRLDRVVELAMQDYGIALSKSYLEEVRALVETSESIEALMATLADKEMLTDWQQETLSAYVRMVRESRSLAHLMELSSAFEWERILCADVSQKEKEPVFAFTAVTRHSAKFWSEWSGFSALRADEVELRGGRCKWGERLCLALYDAAGVIAGLPAGGLPGVLAGAAISTIAYCCQWCGDCGGDCPGVDPNDC